MASAKDSFEEAKFMKELVHLRDTQEAIQSLSAWCLKNKKSAYKIARCWLKVVKKVKTDQKIALFYLFNDVVQHSKRKSFNELIERFQTVLKEAIPHLKEENISPKVKRVIHIWSERGVFNDKFLTELTAILEAGTKKNIDDIVDSFQPHQLCTQIKIMKALEDDTEYKLKSVTENGDNIDLVDFDDEKIRQNLKDRQHGNDYISQVEDSRKKLEAYIKAVDREITKRRQVKDLLDQAKKYYDSLYDEANIVANAYTSFGKKVKNVQKKLEPKMQSELKSSPKKKRKKDSVESLLSQADLSPIPSPDYDAPSPEPDDQLTLKLPDEIEVDHHQLGDTTPPLPPMGGPQAASMDNNMSISEYLTQLATGDPSNGNYYFDSSYQDPPAATAWPAPKSAEDYSQEEPIPEWQIQTIDEEPPDETEVVKEQMIDMEVVNDSAEEDQQLSLQERLSNLAGVPLPPGPRPPPPQPQSQPQPLMMAQPPPFFDQRPPGGGPFRGHDNHGGHPRGHGGHGGFHGGHRGQHGGPRPPFRGSPRGGIRGGRGGPRGGRGGFRGGPPGGPPHRW